MNKLRTIIRLYEAQTGLKPIARMVYISRNTIKKYINQWNSLDMSYEEFLSKSDSELHELFCVCHQPSIPNPRQDTLQSLLPDICKALTKKGMTTLKQWHEYIENHPDGYGLTQFRLALQRYRLITNPTMRMEHKAGDKMFVDYTGSKLWIYPHGESPRQVDVFVAILGCSLLTYVEAVAGQSKEDFISACENTFYYYGGVPQAIVSDNLKAAVTNPGRYESLLNEEFERFAEHYGVTVVPARVRKPRDKSHVENAVKLTYKDIFTRIESLHCPDLKSLNAAIRSALELHNNRSMTNRKYSRRSYFEDIEKDTLGPLNPIRYQINKYDSRLQTNQLGSSKYEYVNSQNGQCSGILHSKLQFYNTYNQTYDIVYDRSARSKTFFISDQIEIKGNNLLSNPYHSLPNVGYSYVNEINSNNINDAGYTINQFYNEEPQTMERTNRLDDPLNGKLLAVSFHDKNKNLLKKETYNYKKLVTHYYFGLNFNDRINLFPKLYKSITDDYGLAKMECNGLAGYDVICDTGFEEINLSSGRRLSLILHTLNAHNIFMTEKMIYQDGITTKEVYTFNLNTFQLKDKTTTLETGNAIKYTYTYPNDYVCGVFTEMTNKNIISPIVEEKIYRNDYFIGGRLTEYAYTKDKKMILPLKTYFSEATSKLSNPVTYSCSGVNTAIYPSENVIYKEYDSYGNLNHVVHNDLTNIVYIWSYSNQFPIAEIKNATYSEVNAALARLGLTSIESVSQTISPNLDKIRALTTELPNAMVSVYSFQPLTGILTSTDQQGKTTYYDYDAFGRLKETYIIDNGVRKVLRANDYHYRNQ